MRKVYSRIESIVGNVISVTAEGVRYGELAVVKTRYGESLAEVIRLKGKEVSLQVYAGGRGISTGDEVRVLRHPARQRSRPDGEYDRNRRPFGKPC